MSNTYLDLHVLQSVPPSNVNRDETGSPKTAMYGGVRRARVSSQAWKRAIRVAFGTFLDESDLGVRSKRLVDRIATQIKTLAPDLDARADELAAVVLAATGIKIEKPKRSSKRGDGEQDEASAESGYLIFLSNLQVENLARYAVDTERAGGTPTKKEVVAIAKADQSFDIALFGRMVADLTDLRVDAAAQVAHAISVHAVENEFDYFTAVDDHATGDHAGAGMIGTVEFNSSTLYRYATVNLTALHEHLGDSQATSRASRAFTRAFVQSMPTGKQNTFANRTLPHVVLAALRTDQPVNLVGAFETSIELGVGTGGPSRLVRAAAALAEHSREIDAAFNCPAQSTWVLTVGKDVEALAALGEEVDLEALLERVGAAATDSISASA